MSKSVRSLIARLGLLCMSLGAGLAGGVSAQTLNMSPVVYNETSLQSCPANEQLKYFYYYEDVPYYRATSWCGMAEAAVAYAEASTAQPDNHPIELTSCVAGSYWTYRHFKISDPSYVYNSPPQRGAGMVRTQPATTHHC
ncbi:MAG: hypothetical protein V4542_11800 [Pseudomonadota bacterium]